MHFEKNENGETTAFFDHDKEIKSHEQFVAVKALDFYTLHHRNDRAEHIESAFLGLRISVLENTEEIKDEETQKVETVQKISEMELPEDQAKLLADALLMFSKDTSIGILISGNALNDRNVRAIEGYMAETMLSQINEQYGFPATETPTKAEFGFRASE